MHSGKYIYLVATVGRTNSAMPVRANSYKEAVSVYCHQPMRVEECMPNNPNAKYIVKGERKTMCFRVVTPVQHKNSKSGLVDYTKVKVGDVLHLRDNSDLDPIDEQVRVVGIVAELLGERTVSVIDNTNTISYIPESCELLYWD